MRSAAGDLNPDTGNRTALDKPILIGAGAALATGLAASGIGFALLAVWWPQTWIARVGWLLTVVVAVAAVLPTVRRHRRRPRRLALGIAAGTGALLGLLPLSLVGGATPTFAAVRHAVGSVQLPSGVQEVSRVQAGNRRCRPDCPQLTLRYRAPGNPDAATHAIRLAYGHAGWRADQGDPSSLYQGALHAQVLPGPPGEVDSTVGHDDSSHGGLITVR
ncbi:MAG TPA: hypothetical protein VGN54_03840 [Mycobacteriales bacterium]|nr:hypothetical protein [Mycobacteriales bacterium]